MEPYIDSYRGWCKDLEEEEDAIREDKTICVERTRSPFLHVQGKRHYDQIEPSDPSETVACSTTPEMCTRSPSPQRKRHCDQIEPSDPSDTVACSIVPELCCSTTTTGSVDTLRPKPGEVYCAYHKQSQRSLAAVILPLTDPGSIGILGTMETLGFSRNVPNCVAFNMNSGRLEWRDGYGDGEPSSHARKYPVIYFTGRRFPENEAAGWVSAGDLRVLDKKYLRASDVPFHRAIRAYLERRTLCQTFRGRQCDPHLPLIETNKVLKSNDSSSFCPVAPLATPNVYLMGPDKSRLSMGQSSWSAQSYGRSLMRGYSKKLPVKLPLPRPTNPGRTCHRKMPSTSNLPNSCRLTGFVVGKHGPKATTLPPLNTLRDFALGAQLGLFAWPEELSPRILDRLHQESPVDENRKTKKARVRKEVQVMPQLATPEPEPELRSGMVSPSNMNSSRNRRDQDGKHTAESDLPPQDPYIIAQSIEDFIQESQDEISHFSSAENSESTYQILSDLIDGDAVLRDEPQEEARWTDGAEWLSLLESGRKDRKKGTICYAITAIAFARWHATQVELLRSKQAAEGKQAAEQVSARILDSYTDGNTPRWKQRKNLNTHLARGRKWLLLVTDLGKGILFKKAWQLGKSHNSVIDVIVKKMPKDEKKMIVLRLLEDQMKLLLQTGRTNTASFCNELRIQELAPPQATFTTTFTQLQEIQTSVTGGELVVRMD
ncbi:hypothetical protein FAGAP_6116 [Fusarium agapanthi]|uniref:Uncharacterized protein n=1 Tax=Fusarium agapanthi TaxID=1803897 RepID=A0A9P5E6K2_9HYPO|nr:hypothetical protein FAGAP_6116 [Fusarium agapanthi]